MPKTCEVCGRPVGDWGGGGLPSPSHCLRRQTFRESQMSLSYVVGCYRRGYEQQKKRADDLEARLRPVGTPATLTAETRIRVLKVPGVEFDLDMVTLVKTKFPGPVGVRAANAVHWIAFNRLGAQYNGVLTLAQIRDLPFGRLGTKTLEALKWLVDLSENA